MAPASTPPPKESPTLEVLVVSQVTPSVLPVSIISTNGKRKITPSAETASPKRIAVINSPSAVLNGAEGTVQRSHFPNPLGGQQSLLKPGLMRDKLFYQILRALAASATFAATTTTYQFLLETLFPGTYGLSMDGTFQHFLQTELPPKPWPRTIAGLPPYFAPEMGPQHTPRRTGTPANRKNGSIAENQNGRDMKDWEPLFHSIKNHFQDLCISITEVIYMNSYVDDEMGRHATIPARGLADLAPGTLIIASTIPSGLG
ncbi:hypothetical protein ACJ72_02465 [Emergomyces africanus]|uniref:Uncharacterized protein n=1 Tax=Emergomyces africanus TaxID=1955775 RepID=A0A1B7P2C8_9EURO|nr:hypothetical protein ACJ72_02465 [Emergomyces africanus]